MKHQVVNLTSGEIQFLRSNFERLSEITSFSADIKLSAKIASYGIFREVGTVNDELARFIFNASSGSVVRPESLRAEFIQWNGLFGVRIFSGDSRRLELRTKGFYDVIHPDLSFNEDGTLHSLFIFPEIIYQIAGLQNVELVLVKSWGMNSLFGGFDPSKGYYQTNFWEIENNDALLFSNLIRQGKLAFMGTHDLIAHIAGVNQVHWPLLKYNAERVYTAIASYFNSVPKPNISALILPYTIGVVLDDLAQPPSYSSKSHLAVLEELLSRISKNEIPAQLPILLTQFPRTFQTIIDLSRSARAVEGSIEIKKAVQAMIQEILGASLTSRISCLPDSNQ